MFQRDYILRMIEMMGTFMQRVKELMDELSQMRLMDEACRRHCGLPLCAMEALSAESLTDLLSPMPRLFASELLFTRATVMHLLPEDEQALKHKSLRLLTSLHQEGPLCELRAARVQALKLELLALLTADELMACAEFLFQGGAYADMEDAIFQAVERSGVIERARHAARGETLLRRAAKVPEHELALARTGSHELRESARELIERCHALQIQTNEGTTDP